MSDNTTQKLSIKCKGKVQGVFFRAYTQQKAISLGLYGWVRNESDGSVLIHASGTNAQLVELIKWCHQGPPLAVVTDVEVAEIPEFMHSNQFEIL